MSMDDYPVVGAPFDDLTDEFLDFNLRSAPLWTDVPVDGTNHLMRSDDLAALVSGPLAEYSPELLESDELFVDLNYATASNLFRVAAPGIDSPPRLSVVPSPLQRLVVRAAEVFDMESISWTFSVDRALAFTRGKSVAQEPDEPDSFSGERIIAGLAELGIDPRLTWTIRATTLTIRAAHIDDDTPSAAMLTATTDGGQSARFVETNQGFLETTLTLPDDGPTAPHVTITAEKAQ